MVLVFTGEVERQLKKLRRTAEKPKNYYRPLDKSTPPGKVEDHVHVFEVLALTPLPRKLQFRVVFSITDMKSQGLHRHLSMSMNEGESLPEVSVTMDVARHLGFVLELEKRIGPDNKDTLMIGTHPGDKNVIVFAQKYSLNEQIPESPDESGDEEHAEQKEL